jgi:GNAT superfamily N-acetyltransferase
MSRVIVRAFIPESDSGAIFASFPNGVYYGHAKKIKVHKAKWFKDFYAYMLKIIEQSNIQIACLEDHPNTIVGYSIINGETLEYVSVKEDYRNQRIGTLLIKNKYKEVNLDNLTKIGAAILKKREGEANGKTKENS